LAHLRACPGRHGEREDTEDEGEGDHQDRTKTRPCGGRRGLLGLIAPHVLSLYQSRQEREGDLSVMPQPILSPTRSDRPADFLTNSKCPISQKTGAAGKKQKVSPPAKRSIRSLVATASDCFRNPQRPLNLRRGNGSSCPISDLRADGFERLTRVDLGSSPERSEWRGCAESRHSRQPVALHVPLASITATRSRPLAPIRERRVAWSGCDPVHTPLPKASLRCCASTLGGSASMPQPKPFTTDAAPTRGRRARHPAPDSTRKNFSSDGTHPFIPPPTREQLMAGSAKLRRVYKVEA
jgi:hypothetical protein